MKTNKLFLITGGNIGDRKKSLGTAAALIEEQVGEITNRSKIYETEAWGITNQPKFYNQVLVVKSEFSAKEVLNRILKIEEEMGRKRTVKNAARVIDIDILFFNEDIVNEQNLVIPHPEISNRRFVLMPLSELDPEMVHPVSKKTMKELLLLSKDQLKVIPAT